MLLVKCVACGADVIWARNSRGEPMPLEPDPDTGGDVVLHRGRAILLARDGRSATGRRYRAHTPRCPQDEDTPKLWGREDEGVIFCPGGRRFGAAEFRVQDHPGLLAQIVAICECYFAKRQEEADGQDVPASA